MWQARGPITTHHHPAQPHTSLLPPLLDAHKRNLRNLWVESKKFQSDNSREIKQLVHGILPAYRQWVEQRRAQGGAWCCLKSICGISVPRQKVRKAYAMVVLGVGGQQITLTSRQTLQNFCKSYDQLPLNSNCFPALSTLITRNSIKPRCELFELSWEYLTMWVYEYKIFYISYIS